MKIEPTRCPTCCTMLTATLNIREDDPDDAKPGRSLYVCGLCAEVLVFLGPGKVRKFTREDRDNVDAQTLADLDSFRAHLIRHQAARAQLQ